MSSSRRCLLAGMSAGPGSAARRKPLVPFKDMPSGPFNAQQALQSLLRADPSAITEICAVPEGCDLRVWQFEHIRQLVADLGHLVVVLSGSCTASTCPVMCSTDEWQYLCAAHRTPRECCAIDYAVHTLDGTSALLCLEKAFPSRLTVPDSSLHYFQSIMRRLYRILSHAFFHHEALFHAFEARHHLCKRFSHFATLYELVSADQLIIPKHALFGSAGATKSPASAKR